MWSANQIFCLIAQNKGAIKLSFSPTLLREESRLRDERNVLLRDTTATNNLFNFTCGKNGHRSLQSCLRRNGFWNHVFVSAEDVDYFISVIWGTITERALNYFKREQEHVKKKNKKSGRFLWTMWIKSCTGYGHCHT